MEYTTLFKSEFLIIECDDHGDFESSMPYIITNSRKVLNLYNKNGGKDEIIDEVVRQVAYAEQLMPLLDVIKMMDVVIGKARPWEFNQISNDYVAQYGIKFHGE